MVHVNRNGVEIIAERRMFAKSIIGSARFLRMPPSSRLLYYDLGMYADDEGVVEAFTVMRQTNATEDDLRVLVSKGFVRILNEDLVTVIMDWDENNYIRSDRKRKSIYADLLLEMTKGQPSDRQLPDICQSDDSIGKDRLGKDRVGKDSIDDSLQSNDDVTDNETTSHNDGIKEIVAYLNERTGSKYRASTDATKRHINARLNEGFTVDDFKIVIDIKADEWLGDAKMKKFLRPQTLFGTNFESYLNQQTPSKKEKVEESAADDEEYKAFMERFKGRYE